MALHGADGKAADSRLWPRQHAAKQVRFAISLTPVDSSQMA
jgi:hypothetical protein